MFDRSISFAYAKRDVIAFVVAVICSSIILSFLLTSTKKIVDAAIAVPKVQEMTASLASLPQPTPPEPTPEPIPKPDPTPTPIPKPKPKPKPKKPVVKHKKVHKAPPKKPVKKTVTKPVKATPNKAAIAQQKAAAEAAAKQAAVAAAAAAATASYGGRVKGYLEKKKKYPSGREASESRPKGAVKLWIVINRSGKVVDYGVAKTSRSNILDSAAKKLVMFAKFPPFPNDAFPGESSHRFLVTLQYERK